MLNSKTLVIHPKDVTTDFLSIIYAGQDWTILSANTSKSFLRKEIESHDRIIMLGHGTEQGMFGFGRFVIDSTWVQLLRQKDCVCIWCNADKFVTKYELKGIYSGMIISEYEEALLYCVQGNPTQIQESNVLFAAAAQKAVASCKEERREAFREFKESYRNPENPIIEFNSQNFFIS